MDLCSNNHEEVCFEAKRCPACLLAEELEEYKRDALEKLEELSQKEAEISELKAGNPGE
jgi:uncharacterized metal-binding protein